MEPIIKQKIISITWESLNNPGYSGVISEEVARIEEEFGYAIKLTSVSVLHEQ